MRSVRGVLKRLAIDVSRLRGRWLMLTEDGVVQAEAARRATAQPLPALVVPSPCHLGDGENERVIVLSGGFRQSHARAVQVLKEE